MRKENYKKGGSENGEHRTQKGTVCLPLLTPFKI